MKPLRSSIQKLKSHLNINHTAPPLHLNVNFLTMPVRALSINLGDLFCKTVLCNFCEP